MSSLLFELKKIGPACLNGRPAVTVYHNKMPLVVNIAKSSALGGFNS